MSAAIQHAYAYARPSTLADSKLHLATSRAANNAGADPFIRARIIEPRQLALAMRLVSDVVRSRHHIPAAMLEKILIEADPVLTWGTDELRVEGFSSCCGIYVRADISERALDADELRPGTTNVDFNAEMRAALAQVRDGDRLHLEVGDSGVTVTHETDDAARAVTQRRVKLPLRWLRGFGEVQAVQRRMEPRFELDRPSAIRFLRALPRAGRSSDAAWVIPSGKSARLGSVARPGAVRVAGLSRLRALEPVLMFTGKIDVHEDPLTGATAWRFAGGEIDFTAVLSPETWRGFSGEGQLLFHLGADEPKLTRLRAMLAWQSRLTPGDISARTGLDPANTEQSLAWLAVRGLVGYDLSQSAWFHRVLPFDLHEIGKLVEAQNPRLKAARKLADEGAVRLTSKDGRFEATVTSKDVQHRVRATPGEERCTCPWFAKHGIERGPCKHMLAVDIVLARESKP